MNARVRLALLATATIMTAVAVVLALARPGDEPGVTPGVAGAASPFVGAVRPDAPSPRLRLRDQSGRVATLDQYRGRPVVLTFLYSHCQDTCPIMARTIASALDETDRPIPALAVSVDPSGDTPGSAQRFLTKTRLSGRMRFLLGSRAALEPIWKAYGIQPQGKGYEHSAYVVLLDGRGHQRVAFPNAELTSDGLAHDIGVLERGTAATASR